MMKTRRRVLVIAFSFVLSVKGMSIKAEDKVHLGEIHSIPMASGMFVSHQKHGQFCFEGNNEVVFEASWEYMEVTFSKHDGVIQKNIYPAFKIYARGNKQPCGIQAAAAGTSFLTVQGLCADEKA